MPFIVADRVQETSTTVGTGSIALAGAVTGYQTFDAVLNTGDTTFYTAAQQGGPDWEVGFGTFTAPSTLARTTIISSSNGGSIVNFAAGTKNVFIGLPASKANFNDQPNTIDVNSSSSALRITQTGSGNALLVEDSANPDSSPFVVDASGNVGIGTTTPITNLDLGSIVHSTPGTGVTASFWNQTGNVFGLGVSAGQFNYIAGTTTANSHVWYSNSAERMRVNATGQLQVGFGSAAAPALSILSHTDTGIYFPTASSIGFVEGGVEAARIDSNANFLVGTTTAVSRVTVNGDVSGTFFVNPNTVSTSYTIPTNYNAMTTGPISINTGIIVTVPSGSTWTVI